MPQINSLCWWLALLMKIYLSEVAFTFTLVSSADFPNLEVAMVMKHIITLGKLLWV